MKPSRWPHHLDDVLAKSADHGGETLAEHTWQVLEKLAALYRLRPTLDTLAHTPTLWHCLFWTCLLHDLGKAARGFQAMLIKGERFSHRHEVLSLAFFDWIAQGLNEDERRAVVAAIASHHRDEDNIRQHYDDADEDPLVALLAELDSEMIGRLWDWIAACADDWMAALGFAPGIVCSLPVMPRAQAVALVEHQGAQRMRHWLRQYFSWVRELKRLPPAFIVPPILLRGLTTTADHMASAHLGTLPAPIHEDWHSLAERVLADAQGAEIYKHQEQSALRSGRSTLLVAPTGSGKTEAALYWAVGDGSTPVSRLFYALPYQASMNAMFDRLQDAKKGFGTGSVGLQHGRAVQALYARFLDDETKRRAAQAQAKWAQNVNSLHARPVKVFSPYQMLKAAFQLRGFEAMLTDYTQAAFIFDEIHAYEPGRLALILALVRYVREQFGARFFVMSATFPQIVRERLYEALALGPDDVVLANTTVFQKFQRHRLHLLDGDLLEHSIERIVKDLQAGKRVLVCVNTVRRAQEMRRALLKEGIAPEDLLSIHSRYIIKDRTKREKDIMGRCGIGAQGQPCVVIATQVVEVSLNIDLDTIYTDPAPLEALLQRFGRVNRACKKGICPVHVFRQPDDGQFVYGRHNDPARQGWIVRATLAELEHHDGHVIDEAQTALWLDAIYSDLWLRSQWEEEYSSTATNAELRLRGLRPFNSNEQCEADFEALFDNVDVLPQRFELEYLRCLEQHDLIEASQYFVGISARKHKQLMRKGLIRSIEEPDRRGSNWMTTLPYSSDLGLSFDLANEEPDFD